MMRTVCLSCVALLMATSAWTAEPAPPANDQTGKAIGAKEVLTFKQSRVTAQTTELEERIFRLSEALKQLEPENASRLLLALKFAREELIRLQMQQTQELLDKLKLGEAATEQKQVLAKLQRLHDLLLSTDLDFQLRLERLRQIRDILRRLDAAIKEEKRELKASQQTDEQQKQLERLERRQATLADLIARQTKHVEQGQSLAKSGQAGQQDPKASSQLAKGQEQTQRDTKTLAGETSGDGPSVSLGQAEAEMGRAVGSLGKHQAGQAVPHQQAALAALKKEAESNQSRLQRLKRELTPEQFASQKKDQSGNRGQTHRIAESVKGLGDSGAKALGELVRAGGNMSGAEDSLDQQQAAEASHKQDEAVKSLNLAKKDLEEEAQKLLDALRGEVRARVLEGLKRMLEEQIAIRETTQAVQPQLAKGSRQARIAVVGLGVREAKLVETIDALAALVEETEFGVALPAALRVVSRQMVRVEKSLEEADASDKVVAAQRRIEADLGALLEAMKQMPSTRKPHSSNPDLNPADRERELNRLLAELKMVRLLQLRVNEETVEVDDQRPPKPAELPATVKQAIGAVETHQDDVGKTTEKLSERLK